MKPMILLRIAMVFVLAAAAAAASARPDLGPGEAVYLIVLTDTATEPEIAALGGRILESRAGRRLAVLRPAGVEALRKHAGVSYVQRIWMGEPGEPALAPNEARFDIASAAAAPPWSTGAYAYDASGNIKSMGQDAFGYDRVGRLTQSKVSNQSQTFTYDHYGNLTKLGTRTITLDEANNNRLKGAGIAYDATGNMTADGGGRTYHYDPLGMVTGIDMTGAATVGNLRMIYTADDERIMVVEPNVTRYRVRDFAGQVLREWTSSGTVLAWERDYLYAGGELVAGEVQIDQRRNGQRHYHKDHLGSTRMVTDGARELVSLQNYLPFGAEITSTEAEFANTGKAPRDPKKFTGHERDYFTVANAPGEYVDYMHARYYAPGWGRFFSVDPGLDTEKIRYEPQQWNRYSYVTNNPLKYVDPDGKDKFMAWLLGGAFKDVSTWDALKGALTGQHAGPSMSQAAGDWAEDHRQMTGGFSPVPTSKTEVAIIPVLMMLGPAGKTAFNGIITSAIKNDTLLVKAAQFAGKSHQSSIDNLVNALAKGNLNPGIGSKNLFGNVMYARSRDGARVFFRQGRDGSIEILAKANKANEKQVIKRLEELYK